jgi:hypothetical protein
MNLKDELKEICNDHFKNNNDHLTLLINDESNTIYLSEFGILDAIKLFILADTEKIKIQNYTDWIDVTGKNLQTIFDFLVYYHERQNI